MYTDNFAYIKAKNLSKNEGLNIIGNAISLVTSNQIESPFDIAKSFLRSRISGIEFFNHIAKLLNNRHPITSMKPDKPVESQTFFRWVLFDCKITP